MRTFVRTCALLCGCVCVGAALAQEHSRNVFPVGQLALDGGVQALVLDQDPRQPWAYVLSGDGTLKALDISETTRPSVSYSLSAPHARDLALLAHQGQTYLIQAGESVAVYEIRPNAREVVRIDSPDSIHRVFAYKHSSGQTLLWAAGDRSAFALELTDLLSGHREAALVIERPERPGLDEGFEDLFVGFEPDSQQDRLYLAGAGGYYIYNVTNLSSPELLTTISSAAVQHGRAIAPTPNGSHVLTLASYRSAPMRVFTLHTEAVRTATGAWTDNWKSELADVIVRWPFAFVAALEEGLRVVNIFDPAAPYTDAWLRTVPTRELSAAPLSRTAQGIVRVAVRNHDGLIAAGDLNYGLWLLRLEAFGGWHGHNWGLPHVSEEQDWDHGPDGK